MTKGQLRRNLFSLSILLVAISSIATYIQSKTGLPVANTAMWWLFNGLILYSFFVAKSYFDDTTQIKSMIFVQCYLLWNCFSAVHGVFIAENYWDWKQLISFSMALLIPIVAYAATNHNLMQNMLRFYIKYTMPLFLLFAVMITPDAYGFYLVPVSFIMLFFPALTLRWKIGLLVISVFVITADLGARSNVIKFAIPILLSFIYYYRLFIPNTLLETMRKLLFIAPVLLFTLAVSDTFNVFKMNDYIETDYSTIGVNADGEQMDDDLKADTRTFIYVEVLATAAKHNSWLIGRSPARGYESMWFGDDDPTGRWERGGSEVAILNIFTWTGIVGALLYCLVFYKASYLAINQTNNTYTQILGLFLAFRWLYAWVEDASGFTLTTVFLWIMIGLCYSKSFRAMSNQEVKFWVRGIFSVKISFGR
jgi:hypothetical protein